MPGMQIKIGSLDALLAKRNLKYCWEALFLNKKNLHTGNYSVYIIVDSWIKNQTTLQTAYGTVSTQYSIKYIGKGTWNSSFTNLRRKRCLNHRKDLYSDNLNQFKNRYLIFFPSTTLDEKSAYILEKELIDAALNNNYCLTKQKIRNTATNKWQLWNKCKGHGNYTRTTT